MAQDAGTTGRSRFWITIIAIVIALVFLYFYQPFETYVSKSITDTRASNIIFWFASLVAVVGYVLAHWQSFRQHFFRDVASLEVEQLTFDTLQIAILFAVILAAGATLQAIEMLAAHLIAGGAILGPVFGGKLLAIILLVILAIAFYLLHRVVRAFRIGRRPGRTPPRTAGPSTGG